MRDRFYVILLISFIVHSLIILSANLSETKKEDKLFESLLPRRRGTIKIEKEQDTKNKQIVDKPDKINKQKPKDSKYLSEKDNKTDKETIKRGEGTEETKKKENINLFPEDTINGIAGRGSIKDEAQEQRQINKGYRDALTVENGEATSLNTIEFKYASFYNRIKKDVSGHWFPLKVIRRNDPTGKEYLFKNRKTILFVILDKEGYVVDVSISKSSGASFLDEEAINAFKRCIQFMNPPKGLIKNDKIEFYFGFEIYNNG